MWQRLTERTEHALQRRALQPINTEQRIIKNAGVEFVVHLAPSLSQKDAAASSPEDRERRTPRSFDPFLPPEEDLTVAQISDTHLGVLNKFNVIGNHLLIVTSNYEDQENLLNLRDFEALWTCMSEFEGLGFYNSGRDAGSSQAHKHLQMVPVPLPGSGPSTPIEPLLEAAGTHHDTTTVPGIPFPHVYAHLHPSLVADPQVAAGETLERYRSMLARVDIHPVQTGNGERASAPYNLLVTRRWMLLVPRSREHVERISVNALGFAGSLFVRDETQLDALLRHGPMHILCEVGGHYHHVSER